MGKKSVADQLGPVPKFERPAIECNHDLIGMVVTHIRELSDKEVDNLGFDPDRGNVPVVVHLRNPKTGRVALVVPQRDPEGNGYGNLLVQQINGETLEAEGLLLADKDGNSCLR